MEQPHINLPFVQLIFFLSSQEVREEVVSVGGRNQMHVSSFLKQFFERQSGMWFHIHTWQNLHFGYCWKYPMSTMEIDLRESLTCMTPGGMERSHQEPTESFQTWNFSCNDRNDRSSWVSSESMLENICLGHLCGLVSRLLFNSHAKLFQNTKPSEENASVLRFCAICLPAHAHNHGTCYSLMLSSGIHTLLSAQVWKIGSLVLFSFLFSPPPTVSFQRGGF